MYRGAGIAFARIFFAAGTPQRTYAVREAAKETLRALRVPRCRRRFSDISVPARRWHTSAGFRSAKFTTKTAEGRKSADIWAHLKHDAGFFQKISLPNDSEALASVFETIARTIRRSGGEFVPKDTIKALCTWYESLSVSDKTVFLRILAELDAPEFEVNRSMHRYGVARSLSAVLGSQKRAPNETMSPCVDSFGKAERQLRDDLRPMHEDILHLIVGSLPEGMKFVVDLRADILRMLRDSNDAKLRYLDANIRALLRNWFGAGFLEIVRVTWDSPGRLLEKIGAYEKVHPTRRFSDLKTRLGAGRRCFAFVHPSLPEEPLVFIHVALVPEIAASLDYIQEETSRTDYDETSTGAAIFWSISNTQAGLKGVELGHLLIKRVVDRIRTEWPGGLPSAFKFSTLSPIPGFSGWLRSKLLATVGTSFGAEDGDGSEKFVEPASNMFTEDELVDLSIRLSCSKEDVPFKLSECLDRGQDALLEDPSLCESAREPLLRLATRYVVKEKKRSRAICPVANFHIRNGAIVERVNWRADKSSRGWRQSCGIMVNYKYNLDALEENHEAYALRGDIAVSPGVRAVLPGPG